MNIDYATTLPLRQILDKMGLLPVEGNNTRLIYLSPFYGDREGRFHINIQENTWADTGLNISGNAPEFIHNYLKHKGQSCAETNVLHWLKFNIGYPSMLQGTGIKKAVQAQPYAQVYKSTILNRDLIRFLDDRAIPLSLARKFLKQLGLRNTETGKEFTALALPTEEDGYMLHNPFVEVLIGKPAITYIHGRKRKFHSVHIFRDIFDYLSLLANAPHNGLDNESIILNAYPCMDNAAAYVRGFGYRELSTWLPNDEEGQQATQRFNFLCRTEIALQHFAMNRIYAGYNSLNDRRIGQSITEMR